MLVIAKTSPIPVAFLFTMAWYIHGFSSINQDALHFDKHQRKINGVLVLNAREEEDSSSWHQMIWIFVYIDCCMKRCRCEIPVA